MGSLDLKNTISDIKSLLDELSSLKDMAEERQSDLEDTAIKIAQCEEQKKTIV